MKPIATLAELLGGINPIGLAVMLHEKGIPINQITGEYDETALVKEKETDIVSDIVTSITEKNKNTKVKKAESVENDSQNLIKEQHYKIIHSNGKKITKLTPAAYEKCVNKMNFILREHGIVFKRIYKKVGEPSRNIGYFCLEGSTKGIEGFMTVSLSKYRSKAIEYINPNTRMKVSVPSMESCRVSVRVPTPTLNWEWCIAYIVGWDKIAMFKKEFVTETVNSGALYTSKTVKENMDEMFFDANIRILLSELQRV